MRLLLLLLLGCLSFSIQAQSQPTYHRARIKLQGQELSTLAELGLETDHGDYAPRKHLINDFSERELARIAAAGFDYDILINDVVAYYQNPHRQVEARGGDPCYSNQGDDTGRYPIPAHFRLGDMAGFYRYQEMLDILDSMRLLYPELISVRAPIDGHLTHEGLPVYWLRISKQPDTDVQGKPEILYTALHHSREPNSLTQLIFYMWHLLENYETDEQVRFLVDNTELYFIPCVNPDGYIFNETSEPDGGGLWRKNRALNSDGTYGVDLNRNYGFEWGFDDEGSSPVPESQTYRGEAPFSEPETQAVRDFCQAHEFTVALNYHTHGNLLIYPWGYSDSPTPDGPTFNALAAAMTNYNDYTAGTGTETVGYVVNGDSDDWMYGDNRTKPSILSMTPEVGSSASGFWPSQAEIIPNCQASMDMNLIAANAPFVGAYAKAHNGQAELQPNSQAIYYEIQRYGLTDGPIQVRMHATDPSVLVPSGETRTLTLAPNETLIDSFLITDLIADLPTDATLDFVLELDNGNFLRYDTISYPFSSLNSTPQWADTFENLDHWQSEGENTWQLTDEDYVSPGTSLTDSPYDEYRNNEVALITLANSLPIEEAAQYMLEFSAKWAIEKGYDYVQVVFRVNGGNWIPGCGRYSVAGSEEQAYEEPVWDGVQSDWVRERIDLTPYLQPGDELDIAFWLISDRFVTEDGFYVDDLALVQRNPDVTSTTNPVATNVSVKSYRLSPNPAQTNNTVHLYHNDRILTQGDWQLFHPNGMLLSSGTLSNSHYTVPTHKLSAGTYILRFQADSSLNITQKLIILK